MLAETSMIVGAAPGYFASLSDDALKQVADFVSACTVPHQVARDFARDTNDSGLLFKITQLQQIAELTLDVAGLECLKRSALKQAKMSDRRISQTQIDKVNAATTKVKALRELHTSNDTVLNSDRAIPTLDSLCDPAPVRDRCL